MRRNTKTLTVIFIVMVLLLLWMRTYYGDARFKLMGIITLLLLVLFAIGATWFLYRNEWRQVLGLKTNGITKKIILKSFFWGMLINFTSSIIVNIIYFLIFKEKPLSLLGENVDPLKVISVALILAPLTEELLFRGFIQGLWQELYSDKEKSPTKLIILVTALLFTISHFGFLYNVSVKQFLLFTIPLFMLALYMGWLRYKYQSIIPSMFAHLGANSLMVILPLIIMIFVIAVSPQKVREIRRQQEVAQYANDTISYNFDPNDTDEWQRSYEKFSRLERPRSEEMIKHLKGTATNIYVNFTIDTCGNIYNVHVNEGVDSMYIKMYGYNYAEDAIKCIQSIPQCKPYIIDGKKTEIEMSESVPLSPY